MPAKRGCPEIFDTAVSICRQADRTASPFARFKSTTPESDLWGMSADSAFNTTGYPMRAAIATASSADVDSSSRVTRTPYAAMYSFDCLSVRAPRDARRSRGRAVRPSIADKDLSISAGLRVWYSCQAAIACMQRRSDLKLDSTSLESYISLPGPSSHSFIQTTATGFAV